MYFNLQNSFNSVGLDHVILVKVASCTIVSWLLGLTKDQALAALSHVWMDGHPLRTYRHSPNVVSRKGWAAADAVERAVLFCLLVKKGQQGSPAVLSTKQWGFCDALFGGHEIRASRVFDTFVIRNTFFKTQVAEGHALTAIESLLKLRPRLLEVANVYEVDSIRVRTHSGAVKIISKQGKLHNEADRDHCLQYMLAVALVKGDALEYADFQDDSPWTYDNEIADIQSRIEIYEDSKLSEDYLDEEKKTMASGVVLILKDGTVLGEELVEYPLGSSKRSDTEAIVLEKVAANLNRCFTVEETQAIMTTITDVADEGTAY